MSASTSHALRSAPGAARTESSLRFGVAAASDDAVEWLLKRNCSITPAQALAAYAGLCALSLGVATFFWTQGARLVMPFAGCELLALAAALVVFARHAGDCERLRLCDGRLLVEWSSACHVDRVEFAQAWVRVEPAPDAHSLIELSGRGTRISVGRYLRPELRPLLADELRSALRSRQTAAQRMTV